MRGYIHVSDLADAHVAALRALIEGAGSAALNPGAGRGWSVGELVDSVRRITKRDVVARVGPRRPGDPRVVVADAAQGLQKLGWRPRYSDLGVQVAHAWAWREGASKTWKRMQMLEARAVSG